MSKPKSKSKSRSANTNKELEIFANIKVVGVGGSGSNAVHRMVKSKLKGIEFIALNTDVQDLHQTSARKKIHIGKNITRGLGAGMNPEIGRQAAEESRASIQETLKGADMVFVTCGFGGGTGTGSGPVVAEIAKTQGSLTVAVVTKPFSFEGAERMRIAEDGLDRLRGSVDAMIVIPNDRLLEISSKDTPFLSAFSMCDDVLRQAVAGITDIILLPGIINVDFADVKAVMQNAGTAFIGLGSAQGEKRAEAAARQAINSPLLGFSIGGAKGVLFAISGNRDMTMWEVQDAARIITESVDKSARIIFGAIFDDTLRKNEMKITVIATGFAEKETNKIFSNIQTLPIPPITVSHHEHVIRKNFEDKQEDVQKEGSDDDWDSSIPAFLRKSRRI
ncbi:MAG: cell division protein FtsZ [Candidatus Niyogibacteria bacterium CG10_big_fil_rev_8_21_14_0_10_42_19]|uniref:Cell division protein FtsZ n=1 Tax=Candidatus Niyogibacteria bacterium CG10_big_fil_rev_8_21_14_0_10_42_19 TaxID=1974725 RepID=A0A2H0TG82_9BACT|nr:MAG: cell division protein FtsZ [Candidatus Niyogibacteria bacterium CG10_big_fil_rev_8_21_14_0_10_42_19]